MKNTKFSNLFSLIIICVLVFAPISSFAYFGSGGLGSGTGTGSSGSGSSSSNCLGDFKANKTIGGLFVYGTCIILSSIIPMIFALAIALFLWGVIQYVINPSDEEKRTKGKAFMLWGIIALTVMFSFWGLVQIFGETFDIEQTFPQL